MIFKFNNACWASLLVLGVLSCSSADSPKGEEIDIERYTNPNWDPGDEGIIRRLLARTAALHDATAAGDFKNTEDKANRTRIFSLPTQKRGGVRLRIPLVLVLKGGSLGKAYYRNEVEVDGKVLKNRVVLPGVEACICCITMWSPPKEMYCDSMGTAVASNNSCYLSALDIKPERLITALNNLLAVK